MHIQLVLILCIIFPITAYENELIFSGSEDGTFHIFHLEQGFSLASIQAHDDSINTAYPHPFLNLLAVCSDSAEISLWTTHHLGIRDIKIDFGDFHFKDIEEDLMEEDLQEEYWTDEDYDYDPNDDFNVD